MKTRALVFTALFAVLTAVGAFLKVPIGPVPITLPIFTAGGGFGYVFQPSFGFLLGLIPCAWIIGFLCRKRSGAPWIALSCLAGLAVLYLIGIPYMALILNVYLGKGLDTAAILKIGMLPFLPGDALKIAVASLVCPTLQKRLCNFDEFRV